MQIARTSSDASSASYATADTFSRAGSSAPLIPDEVSADFHFSKEDSTQCDHLASQTKPYLPVRSESHVDESAVDESKTCGSGRAIFNLIMTAFGIGITFLPKVIASGGWVGGVALLVITNIYAIFCTKRLYHVLFHNASGRQLLSFEELGEVTFGRVGKVTFRLFLCTMLFSLAMYLVDLQANAGYLLAGKSLTLHAWRWIANIPMIFLAWIPSLKDVGVISMGGVLATIGLMGLIVASSAAFMDSAHWAQGDIQVPLAHGDSRSSVIAPLEYHLGPTALLPFCSAVCQAMLAFAVTHTTPDIVRSMKAPENFPHVVHSSFSVVGCVYLVVACASYAAFGDHVSDNVLSSIALAAGDDNALQLLNTAMQLVVFVLCASNFLVLLAPLAADSERLLSFLADSVVFDNPAHEACQDAKAQAADAGCCAGSWVASALRAALRSSVVVAAICATQAVQSGADRISAFMTFVSGVAVMPLTVLIPIGCYWRTLRQLDEPHPSRLALACEVLLVLLGLGCAGFMLADFAVTITAPSEPH